MNNRNADRMMILEGSYFKKKKEKYRRRKPVLTTTSRSKMQCRMSTVRNPSSIVSTSYVFRTELLVSLSHVPLFLLSFIVLVWCVSYVRMCVCVCCTWCCVYSPVILGVCDALKRV